MSENRRVLVLDGDTPSALAVVRSLGRKGVHVHVGERCSLSPFLSARSRWTESTFQYPDPLLDAIGFFSAVSKQLSTERYDLVIPITDDTVQPLSAHRTKLEALAPLAIAPAEALEIMTDKAKTLALARDLGIPTPMSQVVAGEAEAMVLAQTLRFPVVLKPSRSIAEGRDSRQKHNVRYAFTPDEFLLALREPLRGGPVLVQEYIQGDGVGVEVLVDHGEVVQVFQHRRLHEMPLTGGGSSYREAVEIDPALLDWSRELLRAAAWHGVAMVEWKHDPQRGVAALMEVNGRFWGSLPLAVAAGADFPWTLLELMTTGQRPLKPSDYRRGVRARKLSADIFWSIEVLRRSDPSPLIQWPSRCMALTLPLAVLFPRHVFDVQSFADPLPGWLDLKRTVRATVDRFLVRWRRKRLLVDMQNRRRDEPTLRQHARAAKSVLFLCYGNINRSALAEKLFLVGCSETCQVSSAGFHPLANRPADPDMVATASAHDVSLSDARSKIVDTTALAQADLILAMDVSHLERLQTLAPECMAKTLLLGCFDPEKSAPVEITDPYGGDRAQFEACYARIERSVKALSEARRC